LGLTGNIIAALAVDGISYGKWYLPFFIIQIIIAVIALIIALIIAQLIQYGPF
jgi:uncharacterized ion transporter superfamily protein YfcC